MLSEEYDILEKPKSKKGSAVALTVFIIVVVLIAGAIGLILHFTLERDPVPVDRVRPVGNCLPQHAQDKESCAELGCIWAPTADRAPYCTFPDKYGYEIKPAEAAQLAACNGQPLNMLTDFRVNLVRIATPTLFTPDLEELVVSVEFQSNYRLRVLITDPHGLRYKVPELAVNMSATPVKPADESILYNVTCTNDPHFGLKVIRISTGAIIFDTTPQGLVFSDQYIQLTVGLASENLYGLGEHSHKRFKHDMNWKQWTIFTRDEAPVDEWNLYGAQPMYMNLEEDGNANAAFLLNSNAMDVMLQPKPFPAVTFHVIGGVLDFYIFLGPSPENIVEHYTEATGRPLLPPYWALGFQLSRWDYNNLTHVKEVLQRNREADIPQDVQYGDIDYMESKLDFTYDKVLYAGLPEFVQDLHDQGLHYIIILDHAIGNDGTLIQSQLNGTYSALDKGMTEDIFIKDPRDGSHPLIGEVWPGTAVYPDFTLGESVLKWWKEECDSFYNSPQWGVHYDALWIDMNEPSNFLAGSTTGCEHNKLNYPPYVPNVLGAAETNGSLYQKTICMTSEQYWGDHYNVHSLYGHSMAITTYNALRQLFPDKRPLVLTRSNFAGTQKYAAHWLGDNQSEWRQIAWSIVGMLEYSLFGFSYTGADICGFWYATTEEMCQRWMQLGAFYPYSRNHNAAGWPDQDPAAFSEAMIQVSRDILRTRYKLLPHLYTLLYSAHVNGSTVVRPLLHEFPSDSKTWDIDRQFLWGAAFMISPVLEQSITSINAYFPKALWYNYYDGSVFASQGEFRNLSTPLDKINLHVRGGYVIPWQEPANTTVYSRRNAMGLIVALDVYEARGQLFWDDGESFDTVNSKNFTLIEFTCKGTRLQFTVHEASNDSDTSELIFKTVDIWGLGRAIEQLVVDGVQFTDDHLQYDATTQNTKLINLSLNITTNHLITWQFQP